MTAGNELLHSSLNSYAAVMYDKMEGVAREKWAGYTVHLLDRWPPMSDIDCECIVGSMVMTSQTTKQRWMLKRKALPFADTWVTSADLARLYLNLKFKGVKRRITTIQWKDFYEYNRRSMPLSAYPAKLEMGHYIDIRSAYWSILRAVGWDVDYMPGQWLKVKDDITVNDFPFSEDKMARNCLVSLAADGSRLMRIWDGEKMTSRKGGNGLVNKMLYCFVSDVLNGIADECLRAGAIYSFTDGFIVPDNKAGEIEQIIASWGLSSSFKHSGACEVKGAGAYKFDDFRTRKFDIQTGHSIHKVNPQYAAWLKKRFHHFARKYAITQPFDEVAYVARVTRKLGPRYLDNTIPHGML